MWLTLPSQIAILFATHYNKLSLKILWHPFSFITKEFLLFKEAVVWSPIVYKSSVIDCPLTHHNESGGLFKHVMRFD